MEDIDKTCIESLFYMLWCTNVLKTLVLVLLWSQVQVQSGLELCPYYIDNSLYMRTFNRISYLFECMVGLYSCT